MTRAIRAFALIAVSMMLATPFISAAATCPPLSRTLGRNAEGEDVRSLQMFLAERGFLDRIYVLGVFGLKTERAVQAFQTQQGIVTSGRPATTGYGAVGARTRVRIAAVCQQSISAQGAAQSNSAPSSVNIVIPTNSIPVQTMQYAVKSNNPTVPTITISSTTADKVLISFYAMPPETILFMIDPVSGKRVESGGFSPLVQGGSGYISYPMLGEFAGNSYAFMAQSSTTKAAIVTSTVFTVPKPAMGATGAAEVGTLQVLDGQVLLFSFGGITRANAEARCKTEKAANPLRSTRCTWNGYEMFIQ